MLSFRNSGVETLVCLSASLPVRQFKYVITSLSYIHQIFAEQIEVCKMYTLTDGEHEKLLFGGKKVVTGTPAQCEESNFS